MDFAYKRHTNKEKDEKEVFYPTKFFCSFKKKTIPNKKLGSNAALFFAFKNIFLL